MPGLWTLCSLSVPQRGATCTLGVRAAFSGNGLSVARPVVKSPPKSLALPLCSLATSISLSLSFFPEEKETRSRARNRSTCTHACIHKYTSLARRYNEAKRRRSANKMEIVARNHGTAIFQASSSAHARKSRETRQ